MPATGQHKQLKTSHSSPPAVAVTTPSTTGDVASSIATQNDDNMTTFEDDDDNNDCEMALMDGVSEKADNDNTQLNDGLEQEAENASSNNNFARTFFNITRRRMSSGLVLSYNFLKGASIKRRDST